MPKAEGKLGRWVVRQRELHKKGKLETERKKKLDRLEFVWNTNEAAWEHRYALLVRYAETHGHCCVPISDATLGMWVAKMRANRRRNKLSKHRIDKLNAIKFVWNTAETDWMDKYKRLLEFRRINGHSCVPFNEGELGWWVNTQRQNKRKGKLIPHREALLNQAHFVWNPQEFLAARRRHQAAVRASAAHALSASPEEYYRTQAALYNRQYPTEPQFCATPVPQTSSVAYTSNLRKRKPESTYEPLFTESPTSVISKRYKFDPTSVPMTSTSGLSWPLTATITTSSHMQSIQDRGPIMGWGGLTQQTRSIATDMHAFDKFTHDRTANMGTKATSIANLLSPIPSRITSAPVDLLYEGPKPRDTIGVEQVRSGTEQGGLAVLSSVALNTLTMEALSTTGHGVTVSRSVEKLPPISSLHKKS